MDVVHVQVQGFQSTRRRRIHGEDWPFLAQEDIINSLQGVTRLIARTVGTIEQAEYDMCQL